MKINIRIFSGSEWIAFLLPAAIILSQWFSFAGINVSWLLYVATFLFVVWRFAALMQHPGILLSIAAVAVLPPVTYMLGIAPSFPMELYFSLITGTVVMVSICLMNEKENKAFMWGVLFSCLLFTAWGIYEVFSGDYLLFNNVAFFRKNWVGLYYPGVAFANTNDLVQYLVLLFPVSGYLLLKKAKWLFAVMAIAVAFIAFQASSKLGMIVIVMTLLLSYLLGVFSNREKEKRKNFLAWGVAVLLGLLVCDLFTDMIEVTIDNFLVIDPSASYYVGRDNIYTPLLFYGLTHPLGGFGSSYVVTENAPHNMLLYVLCDYGWIPLAFAVLLVVKMVLFAWKKVKEQQNTAFWSLLMAAMCLFVVTASISSCNEQRKAIWIFLGICLRNTYIAPYGGGEVLRSKRFKLVWGKI